MRLYNGAKLICHIRQVLHMLTLCWCCATGELSKGLELERCRGHGFVDTERSHGGEGNALSSALCTDVEVADCLWLRSWPAGYRWHVALQHLDLQVAVHRCMAQCDILFWYTWWSICPQCRHFSVHENYSGAVCTNWLFCAGDINECWYCNCGTTLSSLQSDRSRRSYIKTMISAFDNLVSSSNCLVAVMRKDFTSFNDSAFMLH